MTYVVPNFFIKNRYKSLKKVDNLYILNHITKFDETRVIARNTMNSLVILLEGEKILSLDKTEYKIEKNDITLLSQNNYFTSYRVPKEGVYKSLIIYFDDKFVYDFLKKYSIKPQEKRAVLVLKSDAKMLKVLESFYSYLGENLSDELIRLKIEEIFLHVRRINPKALGGFFGFVIANSKGRILRLLEENADIIYDIEDMCYLTSLSKESLRSYLKSTLGLTPKKWLDELRLKKAKELLKDEKNTVSFVASECGYSSVSWFISKFKERFGVTPREYRAK